MGMSSSLWSWLSCEYEPLAQSPASTYPKQASDLGTPLNRMAMCHVEQKKGIKPNTISSNWNSDRERLWTETPLNWSLISCQIGGITLLSITVVSIYNVFPELPMIKIHTFQAISSEDAIRQNLSAWSQIFNTLISVRVMQKLTH